MTDATYIKHLQAAEMFQEFAYLIVDADFRSLRPFVYSCLNWRKENQKGGALTLDRSW